MVDDISRQIQEGDSRIPRFDPFVIDQLRSEPWRSPIPAHDKIVEDWPDRMEAPKAPLPLPFQAYLFYQLRFILAAHLGSAWDRFGGFVDQLNSFAIMTNLSVTDNSGVAIAYDVLMRKNIAQIARRRSTDIDYAQLLPEENGGI